ncbi:MAG: IS1595 family transposase [Acidobacteriaceae bacterium]
MEKYTIKEFQKQFSTEDKCLDYIFNERYNSQFPCPKCHKTGFYRVKNRKCYACAWCGYQIHPVANTIFHKSDTPLKLWFYAIFLMSQAKNGISAKELQRHLGVTYKTAWRIAKQIRSLMGQDNDPLFGVIETDSTFIGGRRPEKHKMENKTAVFGMVERKGRVRSRVVSDESRHIVQPILRSNVALGSYIMTDDHKAYKKLADFHHQFVKHLHLEYVRGSVHTNTIEGFWSQIKRSINGTYHAVSPKYLQTYLDYLSYQYNLRYASVFPVLMKRAVQSV